MKHYVLGLIFNRPADEILLVKKKRPEWQAGYWNGLGGKIEEGEMPKQALVRELIEETNCRFIFEHVITFVCPGGTVFVFKGIYDGGYEISFEQVEDEELKIWPLDNLPVNMMGNLR